MTRNAILILLFAVVMTSTSGTSAFPATTVVDPEVIAHWKFDEASGTVAIDSSGNGNDGTIFGATRVPGLNGGALDFGGAGSNRVIVPFHPRQNPTGNAVTIEAVVKTSGSQPGTFTPIFSNAPTGNRSGFHLFILPDNTLQAFFGDNSPGRSVLSTIPLTVDQWHHIAATFDGVKIRLYIDRELDAEQSNVDQLVPAFSDIEIGGSTQFARGPFNGIIDELRVSDVALEDTDFLPNPANLTLGAVQLAQVVFDPDINNDGLIDLVAGKPAVALTTIEIDKVRPQDTQAVTIQLRLNTQVDERVIRVNEIGQMGLEIPLFFHPSRVGAAELQVRIDPKNEFTESDKFDNERRIGVDVKATAGLRLAYVKLDPPDCGANECYEPLADELEHVAKANQFVQEVFPISNFTFQNRARDRVMGLRPRGLGLSLITKLREYSLLHRAGRVADPFANRIVGIVPRGWLAYHPTAADAGWHIAGSRTVVVVEDHWVTTAHELGHSFGLQVSPFPEEYGFRCNPRGNIGTGFGFTGARAGKRVEHICFMGCSDENNLDHWVDDAHYEELFREFLTFPDDPELLLVSAFLHSDDRVELEPWHYIPAGLQDASDPNGDYAFRVRDASGNLLDEVAFDVAFAIHLEHAMVDTIDTVPVTVAVPYSESASTVELVHDEAVLLSVSATAKLLADAILSIPDFGFVRNPTQRRRALLNKAAALENAGAQGAIRKLENDLKKHVNRWLVDGYEKESPLQLEKNEVLDIIDVVAARLKRSIG